MYDVPSDIGVTGPATTFAAAYQRLVDDLERALWHDDSGHVVEAYQEFTDAYAEALADPAVYQRVSSALQRLADALTGALERDGARALADEAAGRYLQEVREGWPELTPDARSLDGLLAVATGMTTLAWVYGLGASGLLAPFGPAELFPSAGAPAAPWTGWSDGGNGAAPDVAWSGANGGSGSSVGAEPAVPADADDDGIVWQEFTVGDDGEIVQHTVTPAAEPDPALRRKREAGPPAADPVERVERAYSAYVDGLRAAGAPIPPPTESTAPAPSDLEQRTTDLAGAYLRLTQGLGSLPELVLAYARFLGSSTELIDRELALVRAYERLLEAAAQGRRPAQMRHAVDAEYRRFLDSVRDAWSEIEPGKLPPERLATLAESTARAARLYDTATTGARHPFLQ